MEQNPSTDTKQNNQTTTNISPRDIESNNKSHNKIDKNNKSPHIAKDRLNESYKKTLVTIQKEMTSSGQFFSKFFHYPIAEKIMDILSSTIARPIPILIGGVIAFIVTLLSYLTSTIFSYPLSGSETVTAFLIGWLIGMTVDYTKMLISGSGR